MTMRSNALALAGAFSVAIVASQAPAQAYEGSFFTEQHKAYLENGTTPQPAPSVVPTTRPRAVASRPSTAAAAEPIADVATEAEQDQQPAFNSGHVIYGGAPQTEGRPLASAIPRELVAFDGPQPAGTIVVSTEEKRLYYVMSDGQAIRYGVGVGRPGFEWSGGQTITAKRQWPDWTPPPEMIKRRPEIPHHMAGGIDNPLGARAMYLGGTMYRIHGSNEPDTIGQAVSSGCIRMTNEDVADLYERVKVGTKVIVER